MPRQPEAPRLRISLPACDLSKLDGMLPFSALGTTGGGGGTRHQLLRAVLEGDHRQADVLVDLLFQQSIDEAVRDGYAPCRWSAAYQLVAYLAEAYPHYGTYPVVDHGLPPGLRPRGPVSELSEKSCPG